MRPARLGTGLAALVAPMAIASAASGTPVVVEPIRIDYHASEGCPSPSSFTAEVLARTPRVRIAEPGEAARAFVVDLATTSGKAHGRLVVRDANGGETSREVTGDDCTEVASAISLVLALTVDPSARVSPASPSLPALGPKPVAAPSVPVLRVSPAPLPPVVSEPKERLFLSLGVDASLATVVWAHPLSGASVFAEIGFVGTSLSPSLRLGVERSATSASVTVGAASAEFSRTAGLVELCPWRLSSEWFSLAPFAGLDAGALYGDGSGIDPSRHPARPWVSLGGGARATARLVGPIFADIGAGVFFPLVRDTFYFAPNRTTTVFHADPTGLRITAGLGTHLL